MRVYIDFKNLYYYNQQAINRKKTLNNSQRKNLLDTLKEASKETIGTTVQSAMSHININQQLADLKAAKVITGYKYDVISHITIKTTWGELRIVKPDYIETLHAKWMRYLAGCGVVSKPQAPTDFIDKSYAEMWKPTNEVPLLIKPDTSYVEKNMRKEPIQDSDHIGVAEDHPLLIEMREKNERMWWNWCPTDKYEPWHKVVEEEDEGEVYSDGEESDLELSEDEVEHYSAASKRRASEGQEQSGEGRCQ